MSGATEVPDCTDRARYFPRHGADGQEWPGSTVHKVVKTRLVDLATGEDITEPGRPGELRFKGATTFSQYWNAPELNEAAFDDQGWFRSGDLFEIAGEGPLSRFYRFVGRSKEIIVRGGDPRSGHRWHSGRRAWRAHRGRDRTGGRRQPLDRGFAGVLAVTRRGDLQMA
jgi:cyclohexanecarboxylate-CoA ligase